jgi:2-polyprenyl-3-methyl-5-hydroxy-6-metoxy-1,4-benzoquinol methylase
VSCCAREGYDEFFGTKQARRDARRYRRRGLDRAARWIAETMKERGVAGATVLEPGGGVGAIEIELLKAGAAHSTVVELSAGYDEEARELAREAGVEDRIERRHGDFAANGVPRVDVVVMHRVVCCYPDYERLLDAAAKRAQRILVFTHPPQNPLAVLAFGAVNLLMSVRGKEFRAFVHPPEELVEVVRRNGLEPFARKRLGFWRGVAFARR